MVSKKGEHYENHVHNLKDRIKKMSLANLYFHPNNWLNLSNVIFWLIFSENFFVLEKN